MLEILAIIAVVKAFGKEAEEKNLNKTLWKWIGGLSYYIPILIMSFVILPALIVNGTISVTSETQVQIMAIIINLITGICCCAIAYLILKNQPASIKYSNSDILDEEL